jgi:hypothetical protein
MEEPANGIELQFTISFQWRETGRVRYRNLKNESNVNTLPEEDIPKMWLPLVTYVNTDQREVNRLGLAFEWITTVTVSKEGKPIRSQLDQVEEIETFPGNENTLTMTQSYTWEFQCHYKLKHYPFDTQVSFTMYTFYSQFSLGVHH